MNHAAPRPTIAQRLRALTGVDEEILATIATERPRYTAMGTVVLGTALIAMISMGVALSFVFDGAAPVAMALVPVWGLFILSLDRWLMSSATATRSLQRFLRLLPRILLALAVGTVVAEPLLLGIFDTAIVERVRDNRGAEIVELQSGLLACNPVPGTDEARAPAASAPRCAGLRLSFAGSSIDGKQGERTRLQQQLSELEARVASDTKQHDQLEFEARKECNGTDGPGLSGRFGVGPNCRRLRAQAEQFRADHQIVQNGARIADLRERLRRVGGDIARSSDEFVAARRAAIDRELGEARDRQRGIGLLERMRTLGQLTAENGYARAGEWGVRLFLIVVDALPVLVKFLNGFTTYDALVIDRLARQEDGQRAANQTERIRAGLHEDLMRYWFTQQHAVDRRRVQLATLHHTLTLDSKREQIAAERTRFLIEESPTVQFPRLGEAPPAARRPWEEEPGDEPPIDR